MQHAHSGGIVVDRKENAVRVRLPPDRAARTASMRCVFHARHSRRVLTQSSVLTWVLGLAIDRALDDVAEPCISGRGFNQKVDARQPVQPRVGRNPIAPAVYSPSDAAVGGHWPIRCRKATILPR